MNLNGSKEREKKMNLNGLWKKNCNLELLQQENSNNPRPDNECHILAVVDAVVVVVVAVVGKKWN
jgi:hypothetical protein